MNIILVKNSDFIERNHVKISGRRLRHIKDIIKPSEGKILKVGILNGDKLNARVIHIGNESIELKLLDNSERPPSKLPIKLIVALPRPKTVKKLVPYAVSMGINELFLINSWRVEKSYWTSPILSDEKIDKLIRLGLEQAGDTVPIKVNIRKRFKPFVEDEIPDIIQNSNAFLPHIGNFKQMIKPQNDKENIVIIGPEGGFIEYEVNLLIEYGFKPVSLGERILRVETATIAAISRLF